MDEYSDYDPYGYDYFDQDDFEVYNQNEADDYRNEFGELSEWECCAHCWECDGYHTEPCACQFDIDEALV